MKFSKKRKFKRQKQSVKVQIFSNRNTNWLKRKRIDGCAILMRAANSLSFFSLNDRVYGPLPGILAAPWTDNLLLPTKCSRNDAGAFSDLDLGKSCSFYFCHLTGYTTIPDTLMERKAQQILTSSSHHRWDSKDVNEVNLNISVPVQSVVEQSCPTLCNPIDYTARQLLCSWDSPHKNKGGDFPAILQGIFPIQGLNPGLLHCRQILYHLSHHVKAVPAELLVNTAT